MKIAFCSSEVFPYAKTGGLADVAGALPFALAKKGCQVKVFMPLYKKISPQKMYGEYGVIKQGKVEFIFVRHDAFFLRDALYGTPQGDYPDNLERFSFFSRQVLELTKKMKFSPDVVHCNDWQSALVNIYLKTQYSGDAFFKKAKTALTIHNLAYQGLFEKDKYPAMGLGWEHFNMNELEYYGKINLLKGGIVFSDIVNTVSPTYAAQIKAKENGCGLEGVLQAKGDKVCGILNAIDYDVWNPAIDSLIYKKYTSQKLEDKYLNKVKFQKELGLKAGKDIFMLGMVTRLAEQKGVDILSEAMDAILKKHQVVILGFGDEKYHKILEQKAKKNKSAFSLNLKFDEALAHRIYACCDAFLMPSRFEPCGLSQMISYKYGTVPIVHKTGGLADTVVDFSSGGGGFVLEEYSRAALLTAIKRAVDVFAKKEAWAALVKKVTKYNFSWDAAAQGYLDMYEKA